MNLHDALLAARALNLDGSPDQPRDEQGRWTAGDSVPTTVRVAGNTYAHKEEYKAAGYRWQPGNQVWEKTVAMPHNMPSHAEKSKLAADHPDRAAIQAIHDKTVGDILYKDTRILTSHSGKAFRDYYRGANYEEKLPDLRNNKQERNRQMHVALGHSGYKAIPGSAPGDNH